MYLPPLPRFFLPLAACALSAVVATPVTSAQPRAEYARPEELPGEGLSHQLEVSVLGQYARVLETQPARSLANIGSFMLRTRLALGRNPSYAVGFDGEVGGSDTGLVYNATAYPLGIGARFGDANIVALRGGVGVDGIIGSVSTAARFPVELALGVAMGPLRATLWLRPAWIAGAAERLHGSTWLPIVDELDAGLLLRLGRQHRYWARMSAGGGPAIGVVYREFMGTRSIGVVLGIDLGAEQ